jgi:hypothetical protein
MESTSHPGPTERVRGVLPRKGYYFDKKGDRPKSIQDR